MMNPLSALESLGEKIAIVAVITLVLAILICIFILPESKRNQLNKFFQVIHDFFSIKGLWIELIAKFIFVLDSVFCVVVGFAIFFIDYIPKRGWVGLIFIILGPILCRLSYEIFMLAIMLVKNVMDIRNAVRGIETKDDPNASPDAKFGDIANKVKAAAEKTAEKTAAATVELARKAEEAKAAEAQKAVCQNCGYANPAGSKFCEKCGTKLG